jgi:hypothetical protein
VVLSRVGGVYISQGEVSNKVIDIFSPPREDFYTGKDNYLRQG